MIKPIPVPVCLQQIRAVFKEEGLLGKLETEAIRSRLLWQNKTTVAHLGPNAYSQLWEVTTLDGHRLAIYHQYRDSSGKRLGIPDPKYLLVGQVSLYPHGSSKTHQGDRG